MKPKHQKPRERFGNISIPVGDWFARIVEILDAQDERLRTLEGEMEGFYRGLEYEATEIAKRLTKLEERGVK